MLASVSQPVFDNEKFDYVRKVKPFKHIWLDYSMSVDMIRFTEANVMDVIYQSLAEKLFDATNGEFHSCIAERIGGQTIGVKRVRLYFFV